MVQFLETAAEKHMTYFSQWLLFFPSPLKKNPTVQECLKCTSFHKTRPIKLNETLRSSHFHTFFFFNQMMLISVMILFMNAVNISKYSVLVAISTQYIFSHLFLITNWHIFRYYYPHSTFYTYIHYNLMYMQMHYYSNFIDEETKEQVPGHKDSKEWWN